jgi:molybdate transport system substrate-binding protein
VLGPIPDGVQKITVFSAGVTTTAKSSVAARRLIEYLASPKAWPVIRRNALEPVSDSKSVSAGSGR